MDQNNYKQAFIWSFFANLAPQIVVPLVFLILARLLEPADFGIIAISTIVVSFINLFKDFGLGQSVIRLRQRNRSDFIFTLQLISGAFLYVVTFLLSGFLSKYYNLAELKLVIRIVALQLIIFPFIDIPVYLKMRDIEFKSVFLRNISEPLIGGTIAIIFAMKGLGYWAIVIGQITGSISTAIFIMISFSWKPRFNFDFRQNRSHLKFGFHIFLQNIFTWIMGSADKFFLGKFQDKILLGHYEVASKSALIPYRIMSIPINKLIYPIMAKQNRKNEPLKDFYVYILKKVSVITLPMGLFLILTSKYIFLTFLGVQWIKSIPVFNMLIITIVTATIVTPNIEVYKALNKPYIMTTFFLIRSTASLPVYYYFSKMGIVELASAKAALALIFSPINLYIATRVLGINFMSFLRIFRAPIFATILVFLTLNCIFFLDLNRHLEFSVQFLLASLAIFVCIFFNKKTLKKKLL